MEVRIPRFHNIFGHGDNWQGGREEAPAVICRKVVKQMHGGEIEGWGVGELTRTFLI